MSWASEPQYMCVCVCVCERERGQRTDCICEPGIESEVYLSSGQCVRESY